jgi:hypothetical protein
MRSLRAVMVALGAAAGATLTASLITVGCGSSSGSSSGPGSDGGKDSSIDVGADTHVMEEASTPDADAGSEADVVTTQDSGQEADADGSFPQAPGDWSNQEALALCQGVLNCCPGGIDSGTYDLTRCQTQFATGAGGAGTGEGWFEYTIPELPNLYDAGIAFDSDAGASCLALLRSFPCGTKTAEQWQTITTACFGALAGTLPIGTTCQSSWQCSPGEFCDRVDGGTPYGKCAALVGQGQPCGVGQRVLSDPDQMCSYLGSDQPALFCNLIDPDAGPTCQPLLPNGATCTDSTGNNFYDMACTAGLCGDNATCGATTALPFPFFCSSFVGDGG